MFAFVQTLLLFTCFSRFNFTVSRDFGFKVGGKMDSDVFKSGFKGAGPFLIILSTLELNSFFDPSPKFAFAESTLTSLDLRGLEGSECFSGRE